MIESNEHNRDQHDDGRKGIDESIGNNRKKCIDYFPEHKSVMTQGPEFNWLVICKNHRINLNKASFSCFSPMIFDRFWGGRVELDLKKILRFRNTSC